MSGPKPDYLIKARNHEGKYEIVGAGWKKEGKYGPYISLSIGKGQDKQSYIMDANKKRDGDGSLPPHDRPKSVGEILEDSIPEF